MYAVGLWIYIISVSSLVSTIYRDIWCSLYIVMNIRVSEKLQKPCSAVAVCIRDILVTILFS